MIKWICQHIIRHYYSYWLDEDGEYFRSCSICKKSQKLKENFCDPAKPAFEWINIIMEDTSCQK